MPTARRRVVGSPAVPARRLFLVIGLALLVAGCGHDGVPASSSSASTDPPGTAAASTAGTTATTVDPATLPQTDARPTAQGSPFEERARGLWDAIVADDPARAMPFFFPLPAYLQVKAIKDPAADWRSRLVAAYESDIHELHRRLGPGAAGAAYQGVTVPDSAVWVVPGKEYNAQPYWRVYGSQLHYTSADGKAAAFPIASLISWRGEWFVVHLNSIR